MMETRIVRREVMTLGFGALLAGPSCAARQETAVDVRDFIKEGPGAVDRGFAAALAAAPTVMVPAGNYRFELAEPVRIPSGRTLIGSGRPVLRKTGSAVEPIFLAEGQVDVTLRGLAFARPLRLDSQLPLAPKQPHVTVPWPLGTPPAVAVALGNGRRWQPLQPGADFSLNGNVVRLHPSTWLAGADRVRLWREPALAPLVRLWNTRASRLSDLQCADGALWIGGANNAALNVAVEGCDLSNGQILVHGIDNRITPLHFDLRRVPRNGPRSVRIAGNRLRGRIAEGTQPYYLRFGERAAGIEVQGSAGDLLITGNRIERQAGDGIWLASCVDSRITHNEVHNNALSGIGLETGTVQPSHNCTINDNNVSGSWFDGCDMNFATGPADAEIELINNRFAGNGADMKPVSGGCGILIKQARKVRIAGNLLEANNLAGIWCDRSDSIRISGNRCADNGRSGDERFARGVGIAISQSTNVTLAENIFGSGVQSLQHIGIGFQSEGDRKHINFEQGGSADQMPSIGVWNGRDYSIVPRK